jgi:hypothetical protein
MRCKKSPQSILGITLILCLAVGCGTPKATPIPPTVPPTPEAPTFTPSSTPIPTITPTSTVGPGDFPRRFHVQGNAFVDQFGQPMIFRGLVAMDPVMQKFDPSMPAYNEAYYRVMASWGANFIRVGIQPYSLHKFGLGASLDALDQVIAWAGQHHMYVIINFLGVGWLPDNWFPPNQVDALTTTVTEWTNFWKAVSSRYAGNDVVAFYELFNEPAVPWSYGYPSGPNYWRTWKGFIDTLINQTIRPNDPQKTILVGGLMSAYDLSYAAAEPIADLSINVAYATHPYPNWLTDNHLGWDTAFGNLSSKVPVFATEYSYDKVSKDPCCGDPDIGGIPYHQALIDYLEAHHISWSACCFDAPNSPWPPYLLNNDQTFEPSGSGAYFKSRLLALNFPGGEPPVLPTLQPTLPRPGNLALSKPATASSGGSDSPAEYAVDGNTITRWASDSSDPQWIQVDLGAVYQIHEVMLNWESAYAVGYEIQVSNDSSNWQTIYSTTSGIGGIEDLRVSGRGRYVRMLGTSRTVINGASYGYSLYELEVYGAP